MLAVVPVHVGIRRFGGKLKRFLSGLLLAACPPPSGKVAGDVRRRNALRTGMSAPPPYVGGDLVNERSGVAGPMPVGGGAVSAVQAAKISRGAITLGKFTLRAFPAGGDALYVGRFK